MILQSISIDTHITVAEIFSGLTLIISAAIAAGIRGAFDRMKIQNQVLHASIVKLVNAQRVELTSLITTQGTDIEVHIAEDKVRFEGIGRTLERLDRKSDIMVKQMQAGAQGA